MLAGMRAAHHAKGAMHGFNLILETIQPGRMARLKTMNGSGNRRKNGRGAATGEDVNGGTKRGNFDAGGGFKPDYGSENGGGAGSGIDLAMGDGNNGAIIIGGDGATMQPGMERRIGLGDGHEQPDRQRQNRRRSVDTPAGAPIHKWDGMSHRQTETGGNQAKTLCYPKNTGSAEIGGDYAP